MQKYKFFLKMTKIYYAVLRIFDHHSDMWTLEKIDNCESLQVSKLLFWGYNLRAEREET